MSIDHLQSRLRSLGVDPPKNMEPYHFLEYQFPATQLLPQGKRPHLEPPRFAAQRFRPGCELDLLGMLDAGFYTMIPTASDPRPVQGESLLKIVAYVENTEVFYRFRLETATREVKTSRDFELNSTEMARLLEAVPDHRWVGLVDHLINRESDRACFHVVDNVGSSNAEYRGWRRDMKPDVIPVFKNSLIQLPSSNGPNSGLLELGTSCGHRLTIARVAFENVVAADCFSATCPQCGKLIIDEHTLAEVKVSQQSKEVSAFESRNRLWVRLDHWIKSDVFSFQGDELYSALEMSLASLSPPSLACPPGFSFGAYPATKAVLKQFKSMFEDSTQVADIDAQNLFYELMTIAFKVKMGSSDITLEEGVRRPHFERDMQFWLRRAVNLSIASARWRAEAAAEEDSLLEAMGELNLQGASAKSIGAMFEKLGL